MLTHQKQTKIVLVGSSAFLSPQLIQMLATKVVNEAFMRSQFLKNNDNHIQQLLNLQLIRRGLVYSTDHRTENPPLSLPDNCAVLENGRVFVECRFRYNAGPTILSGLATFDALVTLYFVPTTLAALRVNGISEEFSSRCFYFSGRVVPRRASAVNMFANTRCFCSVFFILNATFMKKRTPELLP